jgi:hypothetical protein
LSTAVTPLAPPGPLVTVKSILAGEPPRQHVLFQMPPEGVWYYRVEYRLWQKFKDGREAWSEWYHAVHQRTCLAWYKRECDAERARKRYSERTCWMGATPREYRITPVWAEQLPYRRDLDENRKNLNRMKRGLKAWQQTKDEEEHGI